MGNYDAMIKFTVFGKPEPQGSSRAFIPKGWKRAVITSDNKSLRSFRQEVSRAAFAARQDNGFNDIVFGKHEPVRVEFVFYFQRPPSIPKKRQCQVVKPDLSKLLRAAEDSLTGIIYVDDAQIVDAHIQKHYGSPERTELTVSSYEPAKEAQACHFPRQTRI